MRRILMSMVLALMVIPFSGCGDMNVTGDKACHEVCKCKTVNQGCTCGPEKGECKCESCSCDKVEVDNEVTVPNADK